jgi:uncharacterized protein YjiS (DUF1127 family)
MSFLHGSIAPGAIVQMQHPDMFDLNDAGSEPVGRGQREGDEAVETVGPRKRELARPGEMVGRATESLRRRVQRFRVYRATWLELKRLSDRELSDLGLGRDELRDLARDAADRV